MAENITADMPVDRDGAKVQTLAIGTTVSEDVDGVSDSFALPASPGDVIRVASTTDCYINFGGSGVSASASACPVFPSGAEIMVVPEGAGYIAFVQVSGAGVISVSKMV